MAIYSDARFHDEILGLGPYSVINTVAEPAAPGAMSLALVLRVDEYGLTFIDPHAPLTTATTGSYHGGWLADEFAALLSLALGVRCEAGELVRTFRGTRDRGRPVQWTPRPRSLTLSPSSEPLLPTITGDVDLGRARPMLERYPLLPAAGATALVRAARQFQRALLIADLDANLAWLHLVSALEVAALYEMQDASSDWSVIQTAWPALATALRPLRAPRRDVLAALLAPQVRAAARYRGFLKQYSPPPPTLRPTNKDARVNWSKSALSRAVTKVYDHRSHALHEGIPFPVPMCSSPRRSDNTTFDERPWHLGVASGDAYWTGSELPMHLHTFVHIAGHVLQTWWSDLATRSVGEGDGDDKASGSSVPRPR